MANIIFGALEIPPPPPYCFFQNELVHLLQKLVAMTAEVLRWFPGNQPMATQTLSQIPEHACLLAKELAYRIHGKRMAVSNICLGLYLKHL